MIATIKKVVHLGWVLYDTYIIMRKKKLVFIAFIFFLLIIFVSRCIVMWIELDRPFLSFLRVSDYHLHHFYLGISLIVLSNWLSLLRDGKRHIEEIKTLSSIIFGIGLGLIADEAGLLLTMEFDIKGDYWAPQSYYLMGILSAVFLLSMLFRRTRSKG